MSYKGEFPKSDGQPATEHVADDGEDRAKLELMKGKQGARRAGVAAESVDNAQVRDYVKPVYAKDSGANARIKHVLQDNEKMQVLFGHLDDASIMDIVDAFQDHEASRGEDIIRQGAEGDCLYIVAEGDVDVFVARPAPDGALPKDKGTKVISLGP